MEEALGGSGVPMDRIKKANAFLDGVESLSGLTSFIVTRSASNLGGTVSIIGNDGVSPQTYSVVYSSSIASGDTFTLKNGNKSITFTNNSGVSITSANDLATYLVGAYPVDFVISDNISHKISALKTLLAATSEGIAGTNTSIYGQVLTVMLAGSSASSSLGDAILITPTGDNDADFATAMGHMIISPEATLQANIQRINAFLDGLSTWSSTTAQERIGTIFTQIDGTSDYSGNIFSKLTTQTQIVQNTAIQLSTAISAVAAILGGSNSDLYRNLVAVNSSLGSSGTTTAGINSLIAIFGGTNTNLVAQVGDPGVGKTLIGNIGGSTTSVQAAISAVLAILGGAEADLYGNVDAANSALGGSGTAIARIAAIFSQISNASSGNVTDELATFIQAIRSSGTQLSTVISDVVDNIGGTASDLYDNVSAANSRLGGSGVTTIAKIGSLGGASSLFAMIGATSLTDLAAALGNKGSGNSSIAALLSGRTDTSLYALLVGSGSLLSIIDGTTTDSGNLLSKLITQIQVINGSSTQLSSAISAVNSSLGGSGTTTTRINSANAALDGVQSLSGLSSFTISTAASNSSGTVSIVGNDGSAGQTYSLMYSSSISNGATFMLTNGGSAITFVNSSGSSITSASALTTYLASAYPVGFIIKSNTNTKVTALKTRLGGSGYSAMSNAADIFALFGGANADLYSNVNDANSKIGGSETTTVAKIGNPMQNSSASSLFAIFGGTSANLADQVGDPGDGKTIIDNIGGSSISVQEALNALSRLAFGNSNFSQALYSQLTSMSSALDNSLNSLPNGATYATVGTVASSDGSGGVNMSFSNGLDSNGTYNLSSADIASVIRSNSTFTLRNGSDSIILYNRKGTNLNTQAQVISYLGSMYPVGSKITTVISDVINSELTMVGGTAPSLRARIANLTSLFLVSSTGIVATDFATARSFFVTTPGATMQEDAQALNFSLDGTSTGSTVQARIGNPTINDTPSDIATVIGGEGDIATRLGDPMTGSSGISSLINAANASNDHGVFNDLSAIQSATNIRDQLSAFLALFGDLSGGATSVTFDFSGGVPASLADFVSKAVNTGGLA